MIELEDDVVDLFARDGHGGSRDGWTEKMRHYLDHISNQVQIASSIVFKTR